MTATATRVENDLDVTAASHGQPCVELGIYEKALRFTGSYDDLFDQVARAGFAFVDLSIDESPERAARLEWTGAQRAAVRAAAARAGITVGGLCLSLHRKIGPGSADPAVREQARTILLQGIDLAADLGVPVVQLAGYYAFYEEATPQARAHYVDCLRRGAAHAARRGILLGIENVDGHDIDSISAAMSVVDEIGSPWLALYPDLGNIAEQGLPMVAELRRGAGRMLALHAKDVRRGEPRRVPMGSGIVDWDVAFAELAAQRWSGRLMIEMWNDDDPASLDRCVAAREFLQERLHRAGIIVSTRRVPAGQELPASVVRLREDVCRGNLALPENGLVAWTGGNLSARDPETGLVAIKPSGMLYDDMTPLDMVVVDLEGRIVAGDRGPSSDTASHLAVYRARPDVMSIVHTHSRYATAFAAVGEPIPCCLTAIADEFGGDIPCGAYASIGGDEIGAEIVRSIGRSPAIVMKQHGVFTVGRTIGKALQAAVMVEDVAATVALARGLGEVTRLDQAEIEANWDRYQNRYGTSQASTGVSR
ncbi:L-ribulose-5-phosphate 3-epimerase UlaE [Austwickia sp. TVS 96-490-7B]|uniref:L-ribulose-5-phosphate 4-epimerase n=1 Tax=Austwickia sp. TVS 96-490-7B TaxID=2830843 RepID=UPI001D6467F5|nr:L-ribulose-5-phosphate 4-epimerase [Austwickia sp. TVS 96-490-7B]MBW3084620.1 L-ribulose-5-phosphate 3-epimerase UlaE [Austwickia sp. TVS 96-490-7B]